MSYHYKGKEPYTPADDAELLAKFDRYRIAEAAINGGPAPIYAEPLPLPARPQRKQAVCGTPSGYKRHLLDGAGEVNCRTCRDARLVYQRDYRARRAISGPMVGPYSTKPGPKPKPLAAFDATLCGSMVGWRQHSKHGQDRCRGCKNAQNEYHAKWRAKKNGAAIHKPVTEIADA